MPVHNATIAAIFDEIADLLDIQGANTFRIRAYRNAARTVGELGSDVKTLQERGTALTDIPGIGEDLARKIDEILGTGRCEFLERLRKEVPPAVTQLLKIPGLGPKRVKTLWHDLDIQTLDQLLRAAKDGRIRELRGFGEKTEQHILEAAQAHLSQAHRFKLSVAAQYAEAFAAYLRKVAGVEEVVVAGSFRRMRETVGDIDILVAAEEGGGVMDRFTAYEDVKEILASGPTRGSVILKSGIQVDVRGHPQTELGGGAGVLHRLQGAQHRYPPHRAGQGLRGEAGEFYLPMPHVADKLAAWVGKELIFGIRPEHITDTVVSRHVDGVAHQRAVAVELVEPTGPDTLVFMQLNGTRVAARVRPEQAPPAGSTMDFVFDISKAVFFDPQTEKRAA